MTVPAPSGPALRDIHMPPPASWWPFAPGWWCLAVLAAIVVALLVWHFRRRRLPKRRWRQANRELDLLLARHHDDAAAFASGVSQLLRRAARLRDPATAGLRGDDWHRAIGELAGGRVATQPLTGLERVMYRRSASLDTAAVATAARQWLRQVLLHGGRRA